jgi:hypothetical protein
MTYLVIKFILYDFVLHYNYYTILFNPKHFNLY